MPNCNEIPQTCYDKLRDVARARETIFYSEIAKSCGVNPKFPPAVIPLLDKVNLCEHAAGRRLLSAVVIAKKIGMPGSKFGEKARELGVCAGMDDVACWKSELKRVHDYWCRH